MDTYQYIKVERDKYLRLRVRERKKVPYNSIIELLLEGHEVFMPELDRRMAYHIKKQLEKKIGLEVKAYPSTYDGMNGYLFKVSLIDEYLKSRREC